MGHSRSEVLGTRSCTLCALPHALEVTDRHQIGCAKSSCGHGRLLGTCIQPSGFLRAATQLLTVNGYIPASTQSYLPGAKFLIRHPWFTVTPTLGLGLT